MTWTMVCQQALDWCALNPAAISLPYSLGKIVGTILPIVLVVELVIWLLKRRIKKG